MHSKSTTRTRRSMALRATALAVAVAAFATGCASDAVQRGYLPGYTDGQVTNQTERIMNLWNGSWVAALAVGVITWGLMLWCVAAYRKRRGDDRLPVQTRYHMPLEIMYTIVPTLMILVLFFYTNRDMTAILDTSEEPDVNIHVIGKQWSWDFNYLDDDVYETGQQLLEPGSVTAEDTVDGAPGTAEELPTLYLPVGERVEFTVDSRDVIHSFWIPAFLFKMDMIPGKTNTFQVVPEREGTYAGKCAELCGEFHSGMLFNVKVVDRAEYDAQMEELRAQGQTGELGLDLNRQQSSEYSSEETIPEVEG
ncbi:MULTISPECIES: cytochrome c oxidase subunit II [Isoptericola]|uniref:aa3-type cytochrome oxidase subunit II n=1 Tax=Isoptericola TaxID=254250 RepID=UPI001FE69DDA|nr:MULTISPECIES: cytochrome c oxidase subunit II [Isoptericola]MDO8145217.1 cytochrome c oxidase subunit II [Isoptericola sp. 178]MDO8148855.1 cytochrome c oxidase subunit II [Isoptericola sp. b515]MDO8151203.1 cytochrome c oxidase subunit II [Isoptericola sp. b408]